MPTVPVDAADLSPTCLSEAIGADIADVEHHARVDELWNAGPQT